MPETETIDIVRAEEFRDATNDNIAELVENDNEILYGILEAAFAETGDEPGVCQAAAAKGRFSALINLQDAGYEYYDYKSATEKAIAVLSDLGYYVTSARPWIINVDWSDRESNTTGGHIGVIDPDRSPNNEDPENEPDGE